MRKDVESEDPAADRQAPVDRAGLAAHLRELARDDRRVIVAIAGPPASGKSTFAQALYDELDECGVPSAVISLDAFHFDDVVLVSRGQRARKGAPFTFDVAGLHHTLVRIAAREHEVAVAVFDRELELSRAAASIVTSQVRVVLVEGLYLLMRDEPWRSLRPFFDMTIMLEVPAAELERRLTHRWIAYGRSAAESAAWIAANDLPNMAAVRDGSDPAELTLGPGDH